MCYTFLISILLNQNVVVTPVRLIPAERTKLNMMKACQCKFMVRNWFTGWRVKLNWSNMHKPDKTRQEQITYLVGLADIDIENASDGKRDFEHPIFCIWRCWPSTYYTGDLYDEDFCVTSAVDLCGIFTQTWKSSGDLFSLLLPSLFLFIKKSADLPAHSYIEISFNNPWKKEEYFHNKMGHLNIHEKLSFRCWS